MTMLQSSIDQLSVVRYLRSSRQPSPDGQLGRHDALTLLRRMRHTRERPSTAGIIWPLKTLPSNDCNLSQVPDTSVIMGQDFPQLLTASSLMTHSPSKTHNHNHNNPTLDLNFLQVTASSTQVLLLGPPCVGSTLLCLATWKWLMSLEEHNMASKLTLTSTRVGSERSLLILA